MPWGARSEFIKRWLIGTIIGWIMAHFSVCTASFLLLELFTTITGHALLSEGSGQSSTSAELMIVIMLTVGGAAVGLSQWLMALRGKIDKWVWIVSGAIAGITGAIGLSIGINLAPGLVTSYDGMLSGLDFKFQIMDMWMIGILVLGVSLGVAVSLPSWFILRRYVCRASRWILANVVGIIVTLGFFVALTALIKGAYLSLFLGWLAAPFIFGAVTGIALSGLLQHPKNPVQNKSIMPA